MPCPAPSNKQAAFVQELLENSDFQLGRMQTTNDHQVTCIIPALPILGTYEMDPGKSAGRQHDFLPQEPLMVLPYAAASQCLKKDCREMARTFQARVCL